MLALFDTAKHCSFHDAPPDHIDVTQAYCSLDFKAAHAFLYAYKDNQATYNAYRREVERLLHFSWLQKKCSIFSLQRNDLEDYVRFCKNPPLSWIGTHKPPRFIQSQGQRLPNPNWRPFVATVSKIAAKQGRLPEKKQHKLSEKALREIFTVLNTFFNFCIEQQNTTFNPISQIRQKSKFIRKSHGTKPVRRLSELQWAYVIETAQIMAHDEPRHERTLFILSALYLMYLRISELVVDERFAPSMNHFYKDADDLWWFTTVGKGNKERHIAVSHAMLQALMRWRRHLGCPPFPTADDTQPLIPSDRGSNGIGSTNQIRNIVQRCFDSTAARMMADGLGEEIAALQAATVHWLRHTGISDDVKVRPREHVRDDAGHSNSQTTDRYIDVDLRERHQSAQQKKLSIDD